MTLGLKFRKLDGIYCSLKRNEYFIPDYAFVLDSYEAKNNPQMLPNFSNKN